MSFNKIEKRETLPEKVSRAIKEAILSGEMHGGEALPTEPELEVQFGVSRAVIRDAIRMLKAQGLIEVKHGKGMYVTHSQVEAFTDALLTTLRRDNATVWDVEQFESLFLPRVFGLAAETVTSDEKKRVRVSGLEYLTAFESLLEIEKSQDKEKLSEAERNANKLFRDFMMSIFDSTHNKMVKLMGEVLLTMRKWRTITDVDPNDSPILSLEKAAIERYIQAVECGNPVKAEELLKPLYDYSESLQKIMKASDIGTSPEIPGDLLYTSYKI